MSYPEIFDEDFYARLLNKKEFHVSNKSSYYNKRQQFIKNYITPDSPYDKIMLMYSTGVGKTLASIAISEEFKRLRNKKLFNKTMIITKNNTIKDIFIKELSTGCCDYNQTNKQLDKLDIDEVKEFKKNVKKNYEFMTFGKVTNQVLGTKQPEGGRVIVGDKLTNLSNRVIIVDEFHNILGNETYNAIQNLLDNSKNFRLVLLSATPFSDNIGNLYQISNLLNEKIDHMSKEEFDKYLVKTSKDLFIKNEILSLTNEGEKVFSRKLKGKVSYMDVDKKNFPRKRFKGEYISGENSIVIFKSVMSGHQTSGYLDTLTSDKNDALYKRSSDASTYVKGGKILKDESSKINAIISEIKNTKGPVFIYSNYVSKNGVKLVSKILNKYGITSVALSEDTDKKRRERRIKIFNSPENKYGAIIKALVGSPVLSEGITLKNVRQVHILEPYWNMSKIDQVIGRAVRRGSHDDLPESERIVDVFLHVAVPENNSSDSIDLHKYMLSYYKDIPVKKTERMMKKISIDCPINKRIEGKNGSRECDYNKCDYDCDYKWTRPRKFDKTTYNKINKGDKKVISKILSLLDKMYAASFKDISRAVNADKNTIAKSLNDIITKRLNTLTGRVITFKNGVYFSTKRGLDTEMVPEILFLDMFERDTFANKRLVEYNNRPKPAAKSKSPESFSFKKKDLSDKPLFGTFINKTGKRDNKFRIVINEQNKDVKDKRNVNRGKVCTSFKKAELNSLSKQHFNQEIPNLRLSSVKDICDNFKKTLERKGLIE